MEESTPNGRTHDHRKISNAELEVLLQRRLKAGNFANVEDMLLQTFRDPQRPQYDTVDEERKAKALEAAARIREMRKGVTLDRPKGMSLREYAHIGNTDGCVRRGCLGLHAVVL